MKRAGVLLATAVLLAATAGSAETIKLKKGGTVDGQVLQVQDDHVILALPRENVSSINGQPLVKALGEGVPAPAFSVKDLNGTVQTVGPGQAKATLLHFWVQWCPHCRSDAPTIQALYDRYRGTPNVRIITVNLDPKRDPVAKFLSDHHATYPVIMATLAQEHGGPDIPALYQITAFPVTLLINGQGIIRYKRRGSFTESGDDVAARVDALLSTGSGLIES